MNDTLAALETSESELHQDILAHLKEIHPMAPWPTEGDDRSVDIRFQLYENGSWAIRTGDSSYDQDHLGFWGFSSMVEQDDEQALIMLTRDLVDQALEHAAQSL